MYGSCGPCHNNYRIHKLENYPEEAYQLLEDSGHGDEWRGTLDELLQGHTSSGESPKSEECLLRYYRSMSTEVFERLYERVFKIDCEMFGYQCETFYNKVLEGGDLDENYVLCS